MMALANSLRRIWSAKNRVPHQTRWGTAGCSAKAVETTVPIGRAMEKILALVALARRTAPTIVVVMLNIFR